MVERHPSPVNRPHAALTTAGQGSMLAMGALYLLGTGASPVE